MAHKTITRMIARAYLTLLFERGIRIWLDKDYPRKSSDANPRTLAGSNPKGHGQEDSVRKANEASAVAALNTIKIAQAKYVIDHKGQYGTYYTDPENGICFSVTRPATANDETL